MKKEKFSIGIAVLFGLLAFAAPVFAQNDIETDIAIMAEIEDCRKTVASASEGLPRRIDKSKELIAIKCEDKPYLSRPTVSYTHVITDPDLERTLKISGESYREKIFQERCKDNTGPYNRSNYKLINQDKNRKKISEIFISYYECLGAYDDKITNGLGAKEALRYLEVVLKRYQDYRSETKLALDEYKKLLKDAEVLLSKYQESQAALQSERLIRSLEALGRIGAINSPPTYSAPTVGNRTNGAACFLVRSWSSGLNKNCVYNCVGSESVQTIGAAEICPSMMSK